VLAVGLCVHPMARGVLLRATLVLGLLVGALATVAPWELYNQSRFAGSVPLSTQLGITVAGANCPATYTGNLRGYWSYQCVVDVHVQPSLDASKQDLEYRHAAWSFAEHHVAQLPAVAAARLGRELGLYRPFQEIDLEWTNLGRPRLIATLGLFVFYLAAAAAAWGAVLLWRRKVPVLPLVAVAGSVLAVAAVTFGQFRYRTPLDAVVVLLAGVAAAELASRVRARGTLAYETVESATTGEGTLAAPAEPQYGASP
jgi:hypothetical protein